MGLLKYISEKRQVSYTNSIASNDFKRLILVPKLCSVAYQNNRFSHNDPLGFNRPQQLSSLAQLLTEVCQHACCEINDIIDICI